MDQMIMNDRSAWFLGKWLNKEVVHQWKIRFHDKVYFSSGCRLCCTCSRKDLT